MAKRRRISKMVLDRTKEDRKICKALETHGPKAMADLVDTLTPFLEEGEQLDLPTLPKVLARLIQDRQERLTQADMARAERLDGRRRRRDRAAAELRRLLIQLRRTAEGHYGVEAAEDFLMITGDTPRSPLPMLRVARHVTQRLRDPDVTPPEPVAPGGPPAREEWAALLEPAAKELRQALVKLQDGRSKGRETLVDKQRALEEHDRDVGRSSRLAEALFGLANRPYIAGRVRSLSPRQRRRRRQLLRERPTAKNQTAKATERVTDRPDARSEAET